MRLIQDPLFKVRIDRDGTSPNMGRSIWRGQHTCVSEGATMDDDPPSTPEEAIIKHQLNGDRGHYSVLHFGFIVLHCEGFPHSVVSQITRHHESHFLVQSGRYTGERFKRVSALEIPVEEAFYLRPIGTYSDRQGHRYAYDSDTRKMDLQDCLRACEKYTWKVNEGYSEEHARDMIPYCFRQNFSYAGSLRDFWHMLDQRGNRDSQAEIQTLAHMVVNALKEINPTLNEWYETHRFTKARLAP